MEQLAAETGTDPPLLENLTEIGVLKPAEGHLYVGGDIIRVEAARSLLDAGLTLGDISNAMTSGLFTTCYVKTKRRYSGSSCLSGASTMMPCSDRRGSSANRLGSCPTVGPVSSSRLSPRR